MGQTLYGVINVVLTFDLEDIPISNELKNELMEWITKYGEWIDWDIDELIPDGIEMEEEHNKQGAKLTEKVKNELRGKYRVKFFTSTMPRSYANETSLMLLQLSCPRTFFFTLLYIVKAPHFHG